MRLRRFSYAGAVFSLSQVGGSYTYVFPDPPFLTRSIAMSAIDPRRGYLLGLTAYVLWGLFPLYFKLLQAIPAIEIVAQRVLWSALLGLVLLQFWKHPGWWRELLAQPRMLVALALCGTLLAANWLIYVWAVNDGRMVEASLGYYISPLINVLLGLVVLRERLRRLQWLAVALAALGVLQQIWQVDGVPWVALSLAGCFGVYGLIHKQTSVAVLPGLVVETWLLLPVALGWLWLHPSAATLVPDFWQTGTAWLLAASGAVTLVPLMCFNMAARHLPYATLGFLQYIAPTLVLLLAVWFYDEPFDPAQLAAFSCIWAGLLIYSVDTWLNLRRTHQRSG